MSKPAVRPQGLPSPQSLSEDTIRRMLSVQEAKIGLEVKQAEISLREIDHNQKIADKSIEAQAEDRKDERRVDRDMHLHRLVFAGAIVVFLIVFVLIALWMGKDALILDVIKVVLGFVGGWGASIAWRSSKRAPPADG